MIFSAPADPFPGIMNTFTGLNGNFLPTLIGDNGDVIISKDGGNTWAKSSVGLPVNGSAVPVAIKVAWRGNLRQMTFSNMDLRGSVPPIPSSVTSMVFAFAECGNLVGPIPPLPPNCVDFNQAFVRCGGLTGAFPAMPAATPISVYAMFAECKLTGSVPSFPPNTPNLNTVFYACPNARYAAGTFRNLSCVDFANVFLSCALTSAEVSNILVGIDYARTATNNTNRAYTIGLNGGTNGAPNAAGIAAKNAILAALPSSEIYHN